jgi:cytochrome c peroxidase
MFFKVTTVRPPKGVVPRRSFVLLIDFFNLYYKEAKSMKLPILKSISSIVLLFILLFASSNVLANGNQPPVSDPNGPYTGDVGISITFDGSGSSDPDGTIVSYDWDFGDGNTGTGVAPTHSYAAAGTYTVTLTVGDDAGASDTATTTASITANQPPVSDPNGPYTGSVGSSVQFEGSASYDPDGGPILYYDWDFGDGGTGIGMAPTYTYAASGLYTVTLTVTDETGTTDTASTTANINPFAGQDLTPQEMLGKSLFFDKISNPDWMSCATCHAPESGWTGPVAGINQHGAVYRGAVPSRFGNRKPPSAAYATFSPIFHYDLTEELFVGGNFWDGRATGEILGNPAADQALGPFLNPVEQNNPSKQAVLEQIASSQYAGLWEEVWGEPISWETPENIDANYDLVGVAIATYEASPEVNQFSSKYDSFLAGNAKLNKNEAFGLELFEGKAMCSACHPSNPADQNPPLFTDFTFDNLGVPKNPENPFYEMDQEFLDDGSPINPIGKAWVDPGLGGFLMTAGYPKEDYEENMGKHKVPTLRNVAKGFGDENLAKAFGHNGYFKSLKSIVNFYNTRDVKPECPDEFTLEADSLKMDCWPAPEVDDNVNSDELGDLGLTDKEEDAIVAFLRTLSDGYIVKRKTK